jgi:hypothetical protein
LTTATPADTRKVLKHPIFLFCPVSTAADNLPATDPAPESTLLKRLQELFSAEQWSALMIDVPFQRFVQNCTDKDQELVVAYALEVLRKRPSEEPPKLG